MGDQATCDGGKVIAMTAIDFFTDANLGMKAKSAFDATHV